MGVWARSRGRDLCPTVMPSWCQVSVVLSEDKTRVYLKVSAHEETLEYFAELLQFSMRIVDPSPDAATGLHTSVGMLPFRQEKKKLFQFERENFWHPGTVGLRAHISPQPTARFLGNGHSAALSTLQSLSLVLVAAWRAAPFGRANSLIRLPIRGRAWSRHAVCPQRRQCSPPESARCAKTDYSDLVPCAWLLRRRSDRQENVINVPSFL